MSAITHEECLGFDASFGACFLGNSVFCIRGGNFLHICRFKDRAIDILGAINGDLTGFSAIAGSTLCKVLAYADTVQNSMVHIVDASAKERGTFNVPDVLGLYSMAFSEDGEWLYSLGGLPTFRLSVFDWRKQEEKVFLTFDKAIGSKVSVCPAQARLFAVYGDVVSDVPVLPEELADGEAVHLRFFTVQGCGENFLMSEVTSNVPDNVVSFCWSPKLYQCFVGTDKGDVFAVDAMTGEIIGEPLKMAALGDGVQNAAAMLCTSKYLIVSGTSGNLYWIDGEAMGKTDDMFVLDTMSPLTFLYMLPGTNSLFFGTEKNSLICVDLDVKTEKMIDNSMVNLRDAHKGPISGCACLPHHLVTAGRDGSLRFWTVNPFLGLVQSFNFGNDVLTCVAASSGGKLVAVGSESGIVRIINTQDPGRPILLFRERLHQSAVTSIVLTANNVCSGSVNGSVVIQRMDPMAQFPLIGLLQLKTNIVGLAAPPPLADVQQLLIATGHKEVIRIDIPVQPAESFKIAIETVNRAMLKVANKIMSITAEPTLREEQQYFYLACDDKSVKYYCMPLTTGDLDIVGVDDIESSAPDDVFVGHPKAVTACQLSPGQAFIASGCAGGSLVVREIDIQTAQIKGTAFSGVDHCPSNGAISDIAFLPDGRKLFTVGYDGVINMYNVKAQQQAIVTDNFKLPAGSFKISVSRVYGIEQQIKRIADIWASREYEEGQEDGFQADDGPGWEETALSEQIKTEKSKAQEAEAERYQTDLMGQIEAIKNEFMSLIKENEEAPELEKLTNADFTLDTVTADRLKQLGELRAQLVHYRRRVKNQMRSLMAQAITDKCFKPYEPSLTTIFSFKTPIKFDNFPLPARDEKMKRMYRCVTMLRRTEIAALRWTPEANDPNRIAPSLMRDTSLDGARYLSSRSNSLITLTLDETERQLIVKDDVKLLYDPFQIVTLNRKITQLVIIQNLIFDEMTKFNAEFDEMLNKKVNLVQSLEEKNKRIRQLIRILRLNAEDYEIFDPVPQDDENPESFLTVRDEEVVLKKQLDQGDKKQEQTDELEKDSFAERALRQMMGGNININSMDEAPDDDEPVRPEWMDQKKKEELTEEEQYQIQEFEKKLKNFLEEREKRRKALNAELIKLVKGNLASVDEFDHQMAEMYMKRFDTEERVYYHELEIMHLIRALNDELKLRQELEAVAQEAADEASVIKGKEAKLAELQELSAQAAELASTAEANAENLKLQVMKEFKNKDCFNQLRRLFDSVCRRIVPKVVAEPNVFQQFSQAPFVFSDDQKELQQGQPPSLAEGPWRNFVEYCERKVQFTKDAVEKGAEANELKTLVKAADDQIAKIRLRLKDLSDKQAQVTDRLLHTRVDMHIPFTFRQGQVEISPDVIQIDYSDVVLIDKKVVMDRNKLILEAGKRKLDELENIRQQHSRHKMVKWEIDKCKVDLENLEEEVKEYQLFRVTKVDQELIMGGGKNRNQAEVNSLNNSLQHAQKTHVVRMQRAKANLKQLQRKIAAKKTENAKIEEEILQMQLGLKERKRIYNIQMKSSEGIAEARKSRLKQVMMISRLKRAKQVQESKIQELQAEVHRLRKCYYPTFNDGQDFEEMLGYQG